MTQEGDEGNVLSGQTVDICSNTAKGRVKSVSIYGPRAFFRLPYSNVHPAELRSCVVFLNLSLSNSVYYIIGSLQSWPLMESETHLHSTLKNLKCVSEQLNEQLWQSISIISYCIFFWCCQKWQDCSLFNNCTSLASDKLVSISHQ